MPNEIADLIKAIHDFDIGGDADVLAKSASAEGMPTDTPAVPTKPLNDEEDAPEQQLKGSAPYSTLGSGQGSGDGSIAKADVHAVGAVSMPAGSSAGSTWTQGPNSRVLYSSIEDARIAKAIEDGSLSPELGMPTWSPLYGLNKCSNCAAGFAKALTVCPGCGTDCHSGKGPSNGFSMSDRVTKSLYPRIEHAVFLPDGE